MRTCAHVKSWLVLTHLAKPDNSVSPEQFKKEQINLPPQGDLPKLSTSMYSGTQWRKPVEKKQSSQSLVFCCPVPHSHQRDNVPWEGAAFLLYNSSYVQLHVIFQYICFASPSLVPNSVSLSFPQIFIQQNTSHPFTHTSLNRHNQEYMGFRF